MTNRASRAPGLLLLFVLASCGSQSNGESAQSNATDSTNVPTARAADPCSLVSSDEVAGVIGQKIVSARADGDSCNYESEDAMASSVTVTVKRHGAIEEMKTVRAAAKALGDVGGQLVGAEGAPGEVGNMLAGGGSPATVGDESLFDSNQQIHVRKGDAYVAVAPPMMRSRMAGGNPMLSAEQKRSMAVAIAQKALHKL
jgi:hypothetical protein